MTRAPVAAARPASGAVDPFAPLADALGPEELARLRRRARRWGDDARALLGSLYPAHDADALAARALDVVAAAVGRRRPALRALDLERELDPRWFHSHRHVGYVAYAHRLGGTLAGVRDRLDHLERLGVTYLHLMHVLRAREGENDGGYAVVDYRDVEPRLGTWDDLVGLADDLRERGIALCLDVVMNHTAREHPWAVAARAGSAADRARYLVFPDRREPDRFEATLPEVFPELAPGSFTHDPELDAWVWTTFHGYQWDLNYANPEVYLDLLAITLDLANAGVDVLRLDAVAFTWKRLGTTSQNQPEAHLVAQLLRAHLAIAVPAVVLKAEAIVGPAELLPYLGVHRTQRPECQLAYHNQLMVVLWDALARGDARLAAASLESLPATPPDTTWVTYLRCHDDIGWAIDDAVAASLGIDGAAHRRYLAEFYRGDAPGSFARGAAFSTNPAAGDERTCGSAAALCGITAALDAGDADALELGVRRLLLGYAVIASFGGIPLVYMGDEVAMGNDTSYLDDPLLRDDSRWLHRPAMDWAAVERAGVPGSLEHRVFTGLRRILAVRRATPALSTGGETWIHRLPADGVLAWARRHPVHGRFYGLANVAAAPARVPRAALGWAGLEAPAEVLGGDVEVGADEVVLGPLAVAWFVDRMDAGVQPPVPR